MIAIGAFVAILLVSAAARRDLTAEASERTASIWSRYGRADFRTQRAWRLWQLRWLLITTWAIAAAVWVFTAE